MSGDERNAALGRSAIIVAAGGALVALAQRPEVTESIAGKVMMVLAGLAIVVGVFLAARAIMRRGNHPE